MKLTIEVKDNNQLSVDCKGWSLEDFVQAISTATLAAMNDTVAKVPEEHRDGVKELIYDNVNASFSSVLTNFAPEYEIRPDLTVQAILEKEDEIINREYEKLQK